MMAFSPCQYGYLHYHADVPQAVELLLESVRERRVTRQIAACERYIGHELGAGDRYLMLADLLCHVKAAEFRTVLQSRLYVSSSCSSRQLRGFIPQADFRCHLQTAQLTKQHLGQSQTVINLNKCYLRFIDFYFDAQAVGFGRHSFFNQVIDIAVEFPYQFEVTLGQLFFRLQRDNLPIGAVDFENHLLQLLVMLALGNLLRKTGDLVIGYDLAAHVYRLRQHHRRHGHIPRIGAQSIHQSRTGGIKPSDKRSCDGAELLA